MNTSANTNTIATTAAATVVPTIGRVLLASIFIFSGIGKALAPAATIGYIESVGLPFATLGLIAAIAVELGGGLLLAFGAKVKPVALLLALFSIVTGLIFHSAIGDQNQLIHLLKNIALAGGLLQVVAFGAGAYSFDARSALTARRQNA